MTSCEKEVIETDFQKAIIGKWEIDQIGNWPNMESTVSTGYTEFRADNVILFFDYELNQFTSFEKYWITDSIIFIGQTGEDNFELITKYKYEFLNNNQSIRMDHIDLFAIFKTLIYKRIK